MTNLRVFEDTWNRRFIEISSATSTLSRTLCLPVLRENQQISRLLNRSELVEVRFEDEILKVPFLLIISRHRESLQHYRLVGELQETDSINVINHVLDVLAWP